MNLQKQITITITSLLFVALVPTVSVLTWIARQSLIDRTEANGLQVAKLVARSALYVKQIPEDVEQVIGEQMIVVATTAAHLVGTAEKAGLKPPEIMSMLDNITDRTVLDEFVITDSTGFAFLNSVPGANFTFSPDPVKQPQAHVFWPLLTGEKQQVIQEAKKREIDDKTFKYAAVGGVDKPRIVEVGYAATILDTLRQKLGLDGLIDRILSDGDVSAIVVVDRNFKTLASGIAKNVKIDTQLDNTAIDRLKSAIEQKSAKSYLSQGFLKVVSPLIDDREQVIGATIVYLSAQPIDAALGQQVKLAVGVSAIVLLLGVLASVLLSRWLAKPVLHLSTAAKSLSGGEWEKTVELDRTDELGELARSFNNMAKQLQASFANLEAQNARTQILNAELSESERRLSQFLDAMPVGVFVTDSQGNPYYTNQTGQHLLGQGVVASAAEQIRIQYQIYQAGSDRIYPQESDPLLNALQGKSVRVEDMEIHHPDKIIPIESAGTPIYDGDGNLTYAIASFQDITERKQAEKFREEYNRRLEEQVAERTAELSQTLTQLQLTQDELVQSEKMAALGQLVAGVAHEINTPLGAIRSSVTYISDFLNENLSQFPSLFRELTPERETQFLELLQRSIANNTTISGRERRQIRKAIAAQIAAQNIEESEGLANILLDLGIHDRLEPFFSLLRQSDSEQFLKTVRAFVRLQASTRDINIASDRAAKVVFALKTYARHNSSSETIEANILDGIDAVLTLYHSQIKQGIELTKNYEQIPPMQCYFDELNQVWTNLIHNALQAMDNKGSLTIDAIKNEENIQISITDSGTGIPLEIHSKIFQPFFTTKPPGEGSGLGLDIVRKIVEKHRGQITFQSRPGQTTFTVILPIER
jgi:signal transduction histidine kinase